MSAMRPSIAAFVAASWALAGSLQVTTASTAYHTTLTSGSGATFFGACISNHGNVVQLEAPHPLSVRARRRR